MARPIRRRGDVIHPRGRTRPASPWDPFAPFDDICQRIGQFVRAVRDDLDAGAWWAPPVDIAETDDAYIVEADLCDGVLTITVPRTQSAASRHIQIQG